MCSLTHLPDDETSAVTAYEEEDGTLTATIHTQEDIYSIEVLYAMDCAYVLFTGIY